MNWFIIGMVQKEGTYILFGNIKTDSFSEEEFINPSHTNKIFAP